MISVTEILSIARIANPCYGFLVIVLSVRWRGFFNP